jgi:hypothetical protein
MPCDLLSVPSVFRAWAGYTETTEGRLVSRERSLKVVSRGSSSLIQSVDRLRAEWEGGTGRWLWRSSRPS